MQKEVGLEKNKLLITACKRHSPAAGATQATSPARKTLVPIDYNDKEKV